MNLIGKSEVEIQIHASADKFFQIFRSRVNKIPQISPENVQAIDVQEGDRTNVGPVKFWSFIAGEHKETAKETIEAIDDENKTIVFKILEGDALKDYKIFKPSLRVAENGEGPWVKWTVEYEEAHEDVPAPEKYLDVAASVTKDIDAYLLSV